jgi:hypothetical protein
MDQTYVRTTIRLPQEQHEYLLRLAFSQKQSLNQLMVGYLPRKRATKSRLEKFLVGERLLEPIRKKYHAKKHRFNQTEVIRKMRDELSGRHETDST